MTRMPKVTASNGLKIAVLFLLASTTPQLYAQSFEQVAVGASHICALDNAGAVECTSTPISERFLPPPDLPPMQDISAGQQHTCGVTLEGDVECWGTNAFGVLDVPQFDGPVASVSSGFNHACALGVNNQVRCWGLGTNGQLEVPDTGDGFVKVDASRTASCGIDTSGDIRCWTTDGFFNPGEPIVGPFIDLDTDSNQACGLTASGEILCWASRERTNLSPPTNGPYSDLTVTNSAICGLRTEDQLLDCSFAAPTIFDLDTASDEYPLDVRFSSIERSSLQFGGVPICGIRADNGTISCFGGTGNGGELPSPPGTTDMTTTLTASNITLGLTADIYGRYQVELFWNQVPGVFPQIFVEVYRDDELLETTGNSFSFYDNDRTVNDETSRYRIRTVDEAGNVGEFSNSIVVDRLALDVTSDDSGSVDNPRPDAQVRIRGLVVTALAQFVQNDTFILGWNIENASDTAVAGYEIRIDNEPVGFVNGTTFIGDGVDFNVCRTYSVAAVSNDGEILDFATVAYGRSTFQCRTTP